jgi:outer membrane protein W
MKTQKAIRLLLSLAVVSSSIAGATANDAILNSDPIDINGYVQQEIPATDQELEQVRKDVQFAKRETVINKEKTKNYKKLVRQTEKLADSSEEMIEERQEAQAQAAQYKVKIDCLMGRDSGEQCDKFVKSDKVTTGMAAPAKVEANVSATPQLGDVIKMLPYAGITSFQSENEDLEADMSLGLRVESDITARFSVGLGFNYTTLKTTDFKNGYAGYTAGDFYDRYSQMYGAGREVEYTNMNFEMYSKYFITKTSRFRPYIGGGIAYNRTSSNYTDNQNQTIPSYGNNTGYNYQNQFGDEEITSNLISARILAGSEILFTNSIGANLEIQYSKALGSSFGDQEARVEGPDQKRLRDLSAEINDAHTFSVSAGILVLF